MLIGKDFEKIIWELGDIKFLEPNAFLGDTVLFFLGINFAVRLKKYRQKHEFFRWWFAFFIVFGIATFFGGLGHLMWNYWGVEGKYMSWYTLILSVFIVEQGMLSLLMKGVLKKLLDAFSIGKFALAIFGLTYVLYSADVSTNVGIGLTIPLVNSGIGTVLALGILTIYFHKRKVGDFRIFWWSILVIAPLVIVQIMKINVHQWFDKNDISHVLLFITMFMYYKAVVRQKSFVRNWTI